MRRRVFEGNVVRALVPLLSLVCVLAGASPDGGGADLRAPTQLVTRVGQSPVKLGEPTTLTITVTHDPAQRYELKTPGDLGDFEYLGQERSRVDGASESTTTFKVRLAAFQVGALSTPELELEVVAPEATGSVKVPTEPLEVVTSLPADAEQTGANLYDVRPPEEVAVRSWTLLYVLAGVVALAVLAVLLRRYLSRKKATPVVLAPPEPLGVRTRRALDSLAAERLPEQGQFKIFYFRLSEIIRGYLGERYGFEAMESTTPELMQALRARTTPGLPVDDVQSFAQASDFVRYAKTEPSVPECQAHLELAYRILTQTQQPSPPRVPPP